MPNVNREKMKSALLYLDARSRGPTSRCCRIVHAKNLALSGAIYTLNISIFVVLVYAWRISTNMKKSNELGDVYYGVQIAYFIIIGTQLSMIVLSIALILGIYRENCAFVVLWVIGFITFMALEAVAMVYSNVLRDHVNRQFDAICKAEVAFFITRAFINAGGSSGLLMDLAANEKDVHADFFNDFEDLCDKDEETNASS